MIESVSHQETLDEEADAVVTPLHGFRRAMDWSTRYAALAGLVAFGIAAVANGIGTTAINTLPYGSSCC